MVDFSSAQFAVFLSAAILLALSPGPGLAYVVARTAAGGREAGIASAVGTGLGGLVHVVAAALGLSVLIAESAFWFNLLRYLGAAYLIYLGICLWLDRADAEAAPRISVASNRRIFWEGIAVETFNVKTALFFLAFLPQFVDPSAGALAQFIILGVICVVLNTGADLIVVFGSNLLLGKSSPSRWMHRLSGSALIGLGAYVALGADAKD